MIEKFDAWCRLQFVLYGCRVACRNQFRLRLELDVTSTVKLITKIVMNLTRKRPVKVLTFYVKSCTQWMSFSPSIRRYSIRLARHVC